MRYSPLVLYSLVCVVVCFLLEVLMVRGWSEARLPAEVLALRHQLAVLERWTSVASSSRSWGTAMKYTFGDEFAAVAIIDRLLHFSTTVNIRGEATVSKTRSGPASSRRLPPCRPSQRLRLGNFEPATGRDRS